MLPQLIKLNKGGNFMFITKGRLLKNLFARPGRLGIKMPLMLLVVLFCSLQAAPVTAQTTIQVFYDNGIHWGDPNMFANDTIFVTSAGRRIGHTLTLPTIDVGTQITAELTVIPDDGGEPCEGDPWDRAGSINLVIPNMPDIELLKFITGYGGYTNHTEDVSYLAPLLQGEVTIIGFIDTWLSPAWRINFSLTFEESPGFFMPTWSTGVIDKQHLTWVQVTDIDPSVTIDIPAGMEWFNLFYFTSGHGAVDEFTPRDNVIYIDGVEVHRYQPWRSDCNDFEDVNPCGYYWWSRSGWCPGDEVHPIDLDVRDYLSPGEHVFQFAVENIDHDDGYWRISSYLAGWLLGSIPTPVQIELREPDEIVLAVDIPFQIKILLQDEEGHWVYDAQTTIRLESDSPEVGFQDENEDWVNPLDITMEHGMTHVWVKTTQPGSFSITAQDLNPTDPLAPPDPVQLQVLENFAYSAETDADCVCNDQETAEMAVDGSLDTKWCCNDALPHWITINLPEAIELNYFVIRHAGIRESPTLNTTAYEIQTRDDSGNWQAVVAVTDNPPNSEGSTRVHSLEQPVLTDGLLLYITDPGEDAAARIYEFEAYYNPGLVAIEEHPQSPGPRFRMYQNFPNPFKASTTVEFFLPRPGNVKATVYNTNGELVKRLIQNELAEGQHSIKWNGKNDVKADAASGLYFFNLEYADTNGSIIKKTTKIVYLK